MLFSVSEVLEGGPGFTTRRWGWGWWRNGVTTVEDSDGVTNGTGRSDRWDDGTLLYPVTTTVSRKRDREGRRTRTLGSFMGCVRKCEEKGMGRVKN